MSLSDLPFQGHPLYFLPFTVLGLKSLVSILRFCFFTSIYSSITPAGSWPLSTSQRLFVVNDFYVVHGGSSGFIILLLSWTFYTVDHHVFETPWASGTPENHWFSSNDLSHFSQPPREFTLLSWIFCVRVPQSWDPNTRFSFLSSLVNLSTPCLQILYLWQ